MKLLRETIRRLILESTNSNAKGLHDLVPGKHTIQVSKRRKGVALYMFYEGQQVFRLTVVSHTGNPDVYMVGAAYVEGPEGDGFGPMMYDIAMEYTTKVFGNFLTADRGSCDPDAQRLWQFYKDNRIGQDGITAIPLDNHRNVVTPDNDDNVDTMKADELYLQSKNYRYAMKHPEDKDNIQKVWYSRSGMMYGYKKEPILIPQLMQMPEVFSMSGW